MRSAVSAARAGQPRGSRRRVAVCPVIAQGRKSTNAGPSGEGGGSPHLGRLGKLTYEHSAGGGHPGSVHHDYSPPQPTRVVLVTSNWTPHASRRCPQQGTAGGGAERPRVPSARAPLTLTPTLTRAAARPPAPPGRPRGRPPASLCARLRDTQTRSPSVRQAPPPRSLPLRVPCSPRPRVRPHDALTAVSPRDQQSRKIPRPTARLKPKLPRPECTATRPCLPPWRASHAHDDKRDVFTNTIRCRMAWIPPERPDCT